MTNPGLPFIEPFGTLDHHSLTVSLQIQVDCARHRRDWCNLLPRPTGGGRQLQQGYVAAQS